MILQGFKTDHAIWHGPDDPKNRATTTLKSICPEDVFFDDAGVHNELHATCGNDGFVLVRFVNF